MSHPGGPDTGGRAEAPAPPQAPAPLSVTVQDRPWRRDGWFIALWVIVLMQSISLVALLGVLVVTVGFFDPLAPDPYYGPMEERYFQDSMVAEDAAVEIGRLIAADDVESFVALYDPDDPHTDAEAARADFEAVAERAGEDLEFTAEWVDVFEDERSGETIARVEVSAWDFQAGPVPGTRMSVWIVIEDGDWELTGLGDRELAPVW